jgi:hypothetical protein
MRQGQYTKQDLLERKERLQLEQCREPRNQWLPAQVKAGAFYGRFNSGLGYRLGGFFSLAVDSHAWDLVNKLVCFLLMEGTTLRAFCLSALWQISETLYLLLRVQGS